MSSSSFVSCPRRPDRGTISWIRQFSAVLDIKQSAARRLNKQPFLFLQTLNLFQLSDFSCQPVSSAVKSCIRAAGSETLFHFCFPARAPSVHHYTEQQLYINNGMRVPEEHRFIQTKYETGEEQMSLNRTGQFFFFSTKKMAKEILLHCQK